MREGLSVECAQPVLHAADGVAERDQVDLAEDGGDLDRDVLDVLAGQQRQIGVEAAGGFALAEDRLAELVQVEPRACRTPLRQIAPQLVFLAGEDEGFGLVAQAGHDRRDDDAREIVAP